MISYRKFEGVSFWGNWGEPAIGNAKEVSCPKCQASSGESCRTNEGKPLSACHVERGRISRWGKMLML
jgi:hypothetical protein